jgi:hypothetical protein
MWMCFMFELVLLGALKTPCDDGFESFSVPHRENVYRDIKA